MALAVRGRPGQHLNRPGRQAADRGRLPAAGDVLERAEDARRGEAAHLDVGREADAELLRVAALAPLRLLAPEALVVEHLERAVERRVVVARVDLEPGRERRRELGDEVLPAELDGIHLELPRERVDGPLDRVRRLRPAGAAVRVGRRLVREHARALEVVALDVVRAAVDPRAEQRRAWRDDHQVRAHRDREPDADRGDRPVRGRRERDLLDHVAPVVSRERVLRALLDPLDREAGPLRDDDPERLLRVDLELRAEPAADVGRDHTQLRLGHAGRKRKRHARDVRDLRRGEERHLTGGRERLGEHAARLHRVRDQPLLAVPLLDGDVRLGEELVDVLAALERPRVAVVRAELLVDERRAVGHRGLDVGDRRERLVVDLDQLRGVLRERAALGDDDGHAVARVARDGRREREVRRVVDVVGHWPRHRQRRGPVLLELGA